MNLRAVSLFLENCGKNAKERDCDSDDCVLPHRFSRKRETARTPGLFFFPADAVTVFGADTTGLGSFSEQVRQTGLTTFYWHFYDLFIDGCIRFCTSRNQAFVLSSPAFTGTWTPSCAFFGPTVQPPFTRGRAMGNETLCWDGLTKKRMRNSDIRNIFCIA